MTWMFYIDELEIDEPIGFAELTIRMKRDENWHGIFFEAATSDLSFYGPAADYLRSKKENEGFAAEVTFRAVSSCDDSVDTLRGRLDFRQYKETCDNDCLVTMPVEQDGCIMTLRNKYDQKVDLDNPKSFNGLTNLPDYHGLDITLPLTPKEILVQNHADQVDEIVEDVTQQTGQWDCALCTDDGFTAYFLPAFENITFSSFGTFNPSPFPRMFRFCGANNHPPYPDDTTMNTEELISQIRCDISDAALTFRLQGNIQQDVFGGGDPGVYFRVKVFRLPVGGDPGNCSIPGDWVDEYSVDLINTQGMGSGTFEFDLSGTIPLSLTQGDLVSFGMVMFVNRFSQINDFIWTQYAGTNFLDISGSAVCEETDTQASLVHEAGSRIIEAITDRCYTMKSDYYGRTDSQPYAPDEDGCGGLRVITSGLKIRDAENPKHFISLKEYFEGLNAIDNIGLGIEDDEVRIEPVEYFYQNRETKRISLIPKVSNELDQNQAYSVIKIGYEKWEVEQINGLGEFNSNKEFRTSLSNISNVKELQSKFVAGGYAIEVTRQQSFQETGAADTSYDNETFIIVVRRTAYGYTPEIGNIASASNIFSPETAYNWRIRPWYNLMRWWKSIAQSYTNFASSVNRLFFSSGTGNLEASGRLAPYDSCALENGVKAENKDMLQNDFTTLPYPLWKPETINFECPMSLKEFNEIKEQPYGFISVQCGTGDYEQGFIINILFKPVKGTADITLRKKWPTP